MIESVRLIAFAAPAKCEAEQAATTLAARRFRKVQVDATTQALRYLKSHGLSLWETLADG